MTRTANGPLVSIVGAMVGAALLLVLSRAVAPKHSWLLDLTHPFRTRGAAFMVGVVALAAALSIASHAKRISLSPLMALTVASVFFGGLSGVQYGTKWTLFSAVSYGTAAAIIVALSFMQTATERLRTRPTLSTFRLDVSLWLAGAVVSLSVLVLFSTLSFTSALATMPDQWRHGVRSTLQAGGLFGVGFVMLVVSVVIARHYVTAERFAGFLVKYWPTCLAASALVAAPAAMSGVVADLFRQYQVGLLTLSSVKARALTIILLTLLLAATLGVAVRLYLISATAMDYHLLGSKYRILTPALFVLDMIWALSPLLIADRIGLGFALGACAALVYMPFAQRTLMKMMQSGR